MSGWTARSKGPLAFALAIAAADQATKWWVLGAWERLVEVTGFFNIVLVWNRGVSFGLFSDSAGQWVLIAVGVAITVALLVWLDRLQGRWPRLAVAAVIGGAAGNIIDRLVHGAVVDFLDLHWAGFHWPAFNLADTAITLGVAVLLLDGLLIRRQKDNN